MKEENITVYTKDMKDKADWVRVKSMTEKDIVAAAKSDPDAPLLTPAELKSFRRMYSDKLTKISAHIKKKKNIR